MTHSVTMILPVAHEAQIAEVAGVLGYAGVAFPMRLSADGNAPATHAGTHTWAIPGGPFMTLVAALQSGQTPPGLEAYGAALASLRLRVAPDTLDACSNWQAALAEASLIEI